MGSAPVWLSKLEVDPSVRSESELHLMPDSLRSRRSCSFAWRAAFAFVVASLFASRSDNSMASQGTLAFLRRRHRASVSAIVRERRRTDARSTASGSAGARTTPT